MKATEKTPGRGADYALVAKLAGGATLRTRIDQMAALPDQPIAIGCLLEFAGRPLSGAFISAQIRRPDGRYESVSFTDSGVEKRGVWIPKESGIYGVDILAHRCVGQR